MGCVNGGWLRVVRALCRVCVLDLCYVCWRCVDVCIVCCWGMCDEFRMVAVLWVESGDL